MTVEIQCRLVGRSGAFQSILFANNSQRSGHLVRAAIVCESRLIKGAWLFAVPLMTAEHNRHLHSGVTVLDCVVQGYVLNDQNGADLQRNLENLVRMLGARLKSMAQEHGNSEIKSTAHVALSFISSAIALSANDTEPAASVVDEAVEILDTYVSVRLTDADGAILDQKIEITPGALAQWLGNHLDHRHQGLCAELELTLRRASLL